MLQVEDFQYGAFDLELTLTLTSEKLTVTVGTDAAVQTSVPNFMKLGLLPFPPLPSRI